MAIRDWFFWKKRAAHDPCHGKPGGHPTLRVAAATMAVTLPLIAIFDGPPPQPPCIPDKPVAQQFNAASQPLPCRYADLAFPAFDHMPPAWQRVMQESGAVDNYPGLSGKDLYDALKPLEKAGLLNLFAKAEATALPDGSSVMDHLQAIGWLRQDRAFVTVSPQLQEQLLASAKDKGGTFYKRGGVDASLHSAHEPFEKVGSYKTQDHKGLLDIMVARAGDKWGAEMDIDIYPYGFRHFFFEVTYNHVMSRHTDPLKIEKILRQDQKIDPGYRLNPK
ncbi:MAG: hypothetical protein ACAH80_05160 [Alphaproteobacteria bacterium]